VHNNKQKYTVYTRTTQIYMYERVCGHCGFALCVCVHVFVPKFACTRLSAYVWENLQAA